MKKYILLLTLFCPLLILAQTENPKSLPSDSLSTTLHAEQLMAKDTLSVPLKSCSATLPILSLRYVWHYSVQLRLRHLGAA